MTQVLLDGHAATPVKQRSITKLRYNVIIRVPYITVGS